LDIPDKRLEVRVSEDELTRRRETWRAPEVGEPRGYLARYAAMVSSASEGAILR
jgi:dihydroxy-acid dehydratase